MAATYNECSCNARRHWDEEAWHPCRNMMAMFHVKGSTHFVDREKAFLDREVVGNSRARRIPACMLSFEKQGLPRLQ